VIGGGEGVGGDGGDSDGALGQLQGEAAADGRLAEGDALHLVCPAAPGDDFGNGRRNGGGDGRPAILRSGRRDGADGEFDGVGRVVHIVIRRGKRARRLEEVERDALDVLLKESVSAGR